MLNFWQSLSTEWKKRFGEHSTRVGNSLVFEISKSQKEYMEKLGNLQYELHFPTSVEYKPREDGGFDCTVTYKDFSNLQWIAEWEDTEAELMDYLSELK